VSVTLDAQLRTDFGKGAARRLRREGHVPAVMYGGSEQLVHISLPAHNLTLALRTPAVTFEITVDGKTTLAKPRDVQRDPVRRTIEHIDLIVIDAAEAQARASRSEEMAAQAEAAAEAAESAPAFSGSYVTEEEAGGESTGESAENADESAAADQS
jgi:ribosomal protein L25 (general stress protein Ctc)